MKILFHNYSSSTSTEPLYLHNALQKCGVESVIWGDPNMSAYDVFDTTKPDVFVVDSHLLVDNYPCRSLVKFYLEWSSYKPTNTIEICERKGCQ